MKSSLIIKVRNFTYKILNKKTVGVRVLLISGEKTLLVKHSYTPLWYMAGGAVDRGETALEAVKRELQEEVGIKCDKFELFGFYYHSQEQHDDYVAVYVVHIDSNHYCIDRKEISQAEWFAFDKLPTDISPGTKRRIEEYLGIIVKNDRW